MEWKSIKWGMAFSCKIFANLTSGKQPLADELNSWLVGAIKLNPATLYKYHSSPSDAFTVYLNERGQAKGSIIHVQPCLWNSKLRSECSENESAYQLVQWQSEYSLDHACEFERNTNSGNDCEWLCWSGDFCHDLQFNSWDLNTLSVISGCCKWFCEH